MKQPVAHDIIASDSFDKAKAEAQIDKMAEQNKARMLAHMFLKGGKMYV